VVVRFNILQYFIYICCHYCLFSIAVTVFWLLRYIACWLQLHELHTSLESYFKISLKINYFNITFIIVLISFIGYQQFSFLLYYYSFGYDWCCSIDRIHFCSAVP